VHAPLRAAKIGIAMLKTITISLPVLDLQASCNFYAALGFHKNEQFSDQQAALMVWSECISVMLLTHEKWRSFTTRPIPAKTESEVGLNISCDSRAQVDAMNQVAADLGGIADINPIEDMAFMYGRDFADPDGHVWGAKWFDLSGMAAPAK
jgi:predicted lactoylglutathione lyase